MPDSGIGLNCKVPHLAWVTIVFDCSSIPLLCKEGLGEVEAWSRGHSVTYQ